MSVIVTRRLAGTAPERYPCDRVDPARAMFRHVWRCVIGIVDNFAGVMVPPLLAGRHAFAAEVPDTEKHALHRRDLV